ncbi:rhodanese-like domain-containing protein [Edaphobacillus lindanitolerans]|uniref:Rhodanese-related sulfurtransferase n=1 Tax=Edaphobacillus lindanitolerans TaxID=550447 RepID=A0A1U7PLL8_9BACI|nr:rhodanese-like domain-containing protein [Edaphobacillus lindanitolerans]SIT75858.1 Rhodanese-related sulfurtransferase [Edaphobacillus lindanitolerans]
MEWIIIAAIVLFFAWRLMPAKGIRTVDADGLKEMLGDKDKQFIDVRTPAEYKGRHIKEFKNIPLNTLQAKQASLDKSKEAVVICQSGMRSAQAARLLKKAGFDRVTNVRGGMGAWNG